MKTDLTFNEVCKFVEKGNPELKEDIDALLNLLLLFSPLLLMTPEATVLGAIGIVADVFGVKDGLLQTGERIFKQITSKSDDDPVEQLMRIKAAYVLICYTAFFDSLDQTLPELMKKLKLKPSEKISLSKSALEQIKQQHPDHSISSVPDLAELSLELPHPANPFDAQKKQLLPLYKELSSGFLKFLESFMLWEELKPSEQHEIKTTVNKLQSLAYERFEALYYVLAVKYEQFFIWANLHEHKKTQQYMGQLSEHMQQHISLAIAGGKKLDVGMEKLATLLETIPSRIETYKAHKALAELSALYEKRIQEPVVDDTGQPNSDQIQLQYPKKSKIFIPQSFQVLRYSGVPLEDEKTWAQRPTREDLGTFLLSYLDSPHSVDSPLIILGHPGSGKSLLTNMIACRLLASQFTPIRVALRGVEANNDIAVQIEEQIKFDTKRDVKWTEVADVLEGQPALILLDGYDELLQASGKVFSGYLRNVQKFQENEIALRRHPVRTIITSRITLIDKADIPTGATILRLLPFNKGQREKWTTIWNNTNKRYFEQSGVQPFLIPESKRLLELAEQPLLLLMLALYDSEGNQLRQDKDLDQTALYDSLLRRFILRERTKAEQFQNMDSETRQQEIDRDLERLAVAAMGMFNRRSLHIKVGELDRDLKSFGLAKDVTLSSGATLTQAELLLGSFFFIYESSSTHVSTTERNRDTAFEFLHNTFGEFLTAEFMLYKIVKLCTDLAQLRKLSMNDVYTQMLNQPDSFPVVCFAYAPLHSRPVILEMMREWLPYKLKKHQLSSGDFLHELNALVIHQITQMLTSNKHSSILTGETDNNPYKRLPTIGHMAIYSLNLILIATMLSNDGYRFEEDRILPYEDGQRAWDRLTHLWRSWFSLENLNGVSAIIETKRNETVIEIRAKQAFGTPATSNQRLDVVLNVALTLADNILAGFSGYFSYKPEQKSGIELRQVLSLLDSENIHLESDIMAKQIRSLRLIGDYDRAIDIYRHELRPDLLYQLPAELLIEVIKLAQQFGDYRYAEEIYRRVVQGRDPRQLPIGLLAEAIKLAQQFGDYRYAEEIYRRVVQGRDPRQLPIELLAEAIKLAQQFGDNEYAEEIYRRVVRGLDPRQLPIGLLAEAIKLAQQFGDYRYAEEIYRRVVQGRDPRQLPIGLLAEAIKLAQQFGDNEYAEEIYRRVVRGLDPRELPIGLLAEAIKLAQQFGDNKYAEEIYHRVVRGLDPRELSSELLAEAIKLAQQVGDNEYAERIYHYRIVNQDPRELSTQLLAEAVKFAQKIGDDQFVSRVLSYLNLELMPSKAQGMPKAKSDSTTA